MSNTLRFTSKIYDGFSKSNVNTNNSICIGFMIISGALFINSILSMAAIVAGVNPLVAGLCGLGTIILGHLSSRFAFNLFRDYNKSTEEAEEVER